MSKVAWIGLGVMGFPMAGHLKDARRPRRHGVQPHARQGRGLGRPVRRQAAPRPRPRRREGADFVFTCVGNDDDLRAVTLGPRRRVRSAEARRGLRRPHHGLGRRSPASCTRQPRRAAPAALDAPVSGGQSGAENGTLTVMVGGDAGGFRQSRARDRGLCAGGQSDRAVRLRPAHQDGQPDLHRRPDRGARRGASLRASAPASTSRR